MPKLKVIDDSDDGSSSCSLSPSKKGDDENDVNTAKAGDRWNQKDHEAGSRLPSPDQSFSNLKDSHDCLDHGPDRSHELLMEASPNTACRTRDGNVRLHSSQEVIGSPGLEDRNKRKRARSCEPEGIGSNCSLISPHKIFVLVDENGDGRDSRDYSQEPKSKKRKRGDKEAKPRVQPAQNELSVSEEYLVDLPAEQYQPRPSRSRSGRGDLIEPVDFSKRPEKVGQSTRKSRDKRVQAEEISAHEKAEIALAITRSLVNDVDQSHDEAKPLAKPNGVSEEDNGGYEKKHMEQNPVNAAEAPKKPRGRPKKTTKLEDQTTTGEAAQQSEQPEETAPLVSEEMERDKEVGNRVADSSMEQGQNQKGNDRPYARRSRSSQEEDKPAINPLGEISGNADLTDSKDERSTEPSPRTTHLAEREPETPSKSSKESSKGPTKHSPISNTKVSYRVGLSKRARIEPLLRIVRK